MGDCLFPLATSGKRRMDHSLEPVQLDVPGLLNKYGLRPDKHLGQNFLIDPHYLKLVADAMTAVGEVKGSTRMGIINQKSSVLARASFETPIKHFINATLKSTKDELNSVIENIILNQPIPVGTGLPGLLVKVTGKFTPDKPVKKLPVKKPAEKKTAAKPAQPATVAIAIPPGIHPNHLYEA